MGVAIDISANRIGQQGGLKAERNRLNRGMRPSTRSSPSISVSISLPMRMTDFWHELTLDVMVGPEAFDDQIGFKPEGTVPPVQGFSASLAVLRHEPPGRRAV